ncbi:phosphoribosylaminoimidazole carboxylase [Companilactobacillus paralimentarius DSM 13238 = JCM 10415]|jgi:Phosphoribosylaminoimidazole carboxylase (NCAIR synthetase)|uniref:Phosphoribosylaminoimidazole carboxylase n=5 Tax=Companilactobacillus TaxID=2767879 RepID=A0ABR5NRP3_9LACO|nr:MULTISPECIES: ATP-grasp domain-containing protein [Companilactobacillus]KAE9559293.1 phosphoribosylaminoimidazole carboxylase [Companilactobacillus kimchii]KAE9560816.1 phosphoribosylaminoimidazole carboxylase [Companilactobacillus kimchii]KAE9564445.1 phosphoribosylaminoimidazole carboxylase [Companilactobacillus paralimentarius]KRK50679.1 phosphoribosylaminoimidazole carboxylase [Companilactobacillus kimchii DSM 13961 = JCM 10707]KRL30797.1 phosphoribosylaminoimidazole carboxylase [Compan
MTFIAPGKTLGIIGGGSETYLFELEAKRMGFRTMLLTSEEKDIATQAADSYLVGTLEDSKNLSELGHRSDILLYMDENFDSSVLKELSKNFNVAQGSDLLEIVQDRYIERTFLNDLNINVPPFFSIVTVDDIKHAIDEIGFPCILKPIQKNQKVLKRHIIYNYEDVERVQKLLKDGTYILEAWIETKTEYSIMVSKSKDQKIHTFPMIQEIYDGEHLMSSFIYKKNDPEIEAEMQRVALLIAQNINYVGIFGIGFILSDSGVLYVKRIFPGINYSANVYQEATGISQFELHIRAICDWPIPEIFPMVNAATLKIIEGILPQSLDLLQEKAQWKFNYYTGFKAKNQADRDVGYISIFSDDIEELKNDILTTNIWRVE